MLWAVTVSVGIGGEHVSVEEMNEWIWGLCVCVCVSAGSHPEGSYLLPQWLTDMEAYLWVIRIGQLFTVFVPGAKQNPYHICLDTNLTFHLARKITSLLDWLEQLILAFS